MHYEAVGIILTNQCNALCGSCCFSCTPESEGNLDSNLVKDILHQISKMEALKSVGFSGGEPFINFDRLVEYIELSKRYNLDCSVTTNGFWAISPKKAVTVLQKLKKAGLSSICFSTDSFHQQYINVSNIKNGIRAAKSLGLLIQVQSVILSDTQIGDFLNELSSDLIDVNLGLIPCFPVGRATQLCNSKSMIRLTPIEQRLCRKNGTLSIDYDGNIWPCCSPMVIKTSLSVGNIHKISLSKAYENLRNNLILKKLRSRGFDYFVNIIRREKLFRLPKKIVSSCELCHILFREENLIKLLPFLPI